MTAENWEFAWPDPRVRPSKKVGHFWTSLVGQFSTSLDTERSKTPYSRSQCVPESAVASSDKSDKSEDHACWCGIRARSATTEDIAPATA